MDRPERRAAGGSEDGSFQALRSDVNHSPAFDGQALQDEDEAELLRDDEERENELKELLTTAFDDEDGNLLEDDCSSESSHGSHESGRHSTGQHGPAAWHRLHDGAGRVIGTQTVSTPVAAHLLPPLLTPCYDAPARQQAALRHASSSAGSASPEQQLQQPADSRPRTAASGRSGDLSGKSGDAAIGGSRSSSGSGGSCTTMPSHRDQPDAGRQPTATTTTTGYLRHRRQARPDDGSVRGDRLADLAGSSGSSGGSCLQSSSAASSSSSSSHCAEQFSTGEGAQLGGSAAVVADRSLRNAVGGGGGRDLRSAVGGRDVGWDFAASAGGTLAQRQSPLAVSAAAYQKQRRATSPSPEQHSPLPPRDDGDGALQADYFYQGVGLQSDGRQLEVLLHAKGRQLQDLTERYELLQLESSKEIRLLKHQLALMEGENRGLDGSLKEARSLLVAAAEERQRWHVEAEQQQAAVRRLAAERDKAIEEQHSAEATAEALSQQLLMVGGSDGHARARQQHDAVMAALGERHEAALADKQRIIADLTAQLRAQKDECESLRSELAASRLAAQSKQAEHAEIVNKLAKSLDECQRQNNDLLLTGTTQELMKLKVELQQASASRLLTEQLCSSLQSEVEHLKEQLSMYEAACSLGVMTAPGATATSTALNLTASTSAAEESGGGGTLLLPTVMDDSGPSQRLSWRTPAVSKVPPPSDSAIPRSPSPIDCGGASPMLKSELQRALLSTKAKREQISSLQATVRQLQAEAHDAASESATLKRRLGEAEALLRDRETELQLYKTAAEQGSSIAEVRGRKELDGLRSELQTVKAELEETTRRLHEVAASEECLNDINDELRRQMAQLVKDFDEDKRASLDKCQETLLRHHEDVKHAYVAEQRALLEHELAEQEACSRAVLVRLRQELDDKEKELTSIKEQYVQLAEDKRHAAELATKQMSEVRRSCEVDKESALRAQLDAQRLAVDGAVLAARQQWAEQQRDAHSEEYKQITAKCVELQGRLERLQREAAGRTGGTAAESAATGKSGGSGASQPAVPRQLSSSLPARLSSAAGDRAPEVAEAVEPRELSASCGPPAVAAAVVTTTTVPTAERGSSSEARDVRAASDRRLASTLALHAAEMARLRAQHESDRSRLLRLHEEAAAEQRAIAEGRVLAATAETQRACEARFSEQMAAREDALRADYEQRVAELRRDLDEMRALARRLEETLESSRKRHAESVAELTARHDRSLAEARAQHDRSLADVRQRHEENLRCALAEAQRIRATEVERAGLECRDFNAELQRACSALERQRASQEQQRTALEAALREQGELQAALHSALDGQRRARDELDATDAELRRLRVVLGAAEAERDRLRSTVADAERRLADAETSARGARGELERIRSAALASADGEQEARRALLACRADAERLSTAAEAAAEERSALEQALLGVRGEQLSMRSALLSASELRLQTQDALQRSEEGRQRAEQALAALDARRQRLEAELGAAAVDRGRLEAELRTADEGLRRAEAAAAEMRAEHGRAVDEMAAEHERRLAECAERHASALSAALEQARDEAEQNQKAMADTLERLTAEMKSERERLTELHNQRLANALDDATSRAKDEFSALDRRLREQMAASLDEVHCRLHVASAERDRAVSSTNAVWAAATDLLKAVQKQAPAQLSALTPSSDRSLGGIGDAWDVGARCSALQQSGAILSGLLGDLYEQSSRSAAQLVRLEEALQRSEAALQAEREAGAGRAAELERALAAAAAASAAAQEQLRLLAAERGSEAAQRPSSEAVESCCRALPAGHGPCSTSGGGSSGGAMAESHEDQQRRYAEVFCSVQEDVSSYIAETNKKAAGMIHTEVSAARSTTERLRKFCIKSLKKIMSGQKENQQLVSELQQLRTMLAREEWKLQSSKRTEDGPSADHCLPCSCCCCHHSRSNEGRTGTVASSSATAGNCCGGGSSASVLPRVEPTPQDGSAEQHVAAAPGRCHHSTSAADRPPHAALPNAIVVPAAAPLSGASAALPWRQDKPMSADDLSQFAKLPRPATSEPHVPWHSAGAAAGIVSSFSLPAGSVHRSDAATMHAMDGITRPHCGASSPSMGDRGRSNNRILTSVMSVDGSHCRQSNRAELRGSDQLPSAKLSAGKHTIASCAPPAGNCAAACSVVEARITQSQHLGSMQFDAHR